MSPLDAKRDYMERKVKLPQPLSLRPKQGAELLGVGIATFWRWARTRPDFPQPIRLSPRCTVFDAEALKAWRDAQVSAKGGSHGDA